MKLSLTVACASVLFSLSATAQIGVEGFEAGNPDGWEIWFSNYNSIKSAGGNPGAYLQLDNVTSGPANCDFVEIFPTGSTSGFLHSGDWRASGVDSVSIDLDVRQGIYGGDMLLSLISDPGTPADPADDCIITLTVPAAGPAAPGWMTYTFDVPSAELAMPFNWDIDSMSPCASGNPDPAWNQVMQDVDRMKITYDGDPIQFCLFTNWIMGVDNIAVNGSGAQLGTNYCMANPNSTGVPAVISGAGSNVAADNDVTLTCTSMPSLSFGFFVTGPQQGFVPNPGGSSGNLCVTGAVGRYVGPGQIQNSGSQSEISLTLDLTQHPTPTGFVSVQAGETWNFTTWFRDTSVTGPTSNFSDGYSIVFS